MRPSQSIIALLFVGVCSLSRSGVAEPQPEATAARAHFDRGVALGDMGELDAAIEEFEQAYELQPNTAVLFNLGQGYSVLGKPVEAVRSLRRYLAETDALGTERRKQVEEMIRINERKIGFVDISVVPADAELIVDGRSLGKGPWLEPVQLRTGPHGVVVLAEGYAPHVQSLSVMAMQHQPLMLALDPVVLTNTLAAMPGQLRVACSVPGVVVEIDGAMRGTTPMSATLLIQPGVHRLKLHREGYVSFEKVVEIHSDESIEQSCELHAEPHLQGAARLEIHSSERSAAILVDGSTFVGQRLPPGPHRVVVQLSGFQPWVRTVNLPAGGLQVLRVELVPTPEQVFLSAERGRHMRRLALIGAGIGVALAAAGTTTEVLNSPRYKDWRAARDQLAADLAAGKTGPDTSTRSEQLSAKASSIQRADDLGLGLGILAGCVLSAAGVLWFSAPDSSPSDRGPRITVRSDGLVLQGLW